MREADVIWAVDNSKSMAEEVLGFDTGLLTFYLTSYSQRVDVRTVLVSAASGAPQGICIGAPMGSGSCPADSNTPDFVHIDSQVSSGNALQLLLSQYPAYKSFLRQSAVKYFAVFSDGDSSVSAASFAESLAAIDPGWLDEWKTLGLVCESDCLACQTRGEVYSTLASTTGGASEDLCDLPADLDAVYKRLAQRVVDGARFPCSFPIPPPPGGGANDPALINLLLWPGGEEPGLLPFSQTDGWSFVDPNNPTEIVLRGNACSKARAALTGDFEVIQECPPRAR